MIPINELLFLNYPTFTGIIRLLTSKTNLGPLVVAVVLVAGQESTHRKCAQHFPTERLIEQ